MPNYKNIRNQKLANEIEEKNTVLNNKKNRFKILKADEDRSGEVLPRLYILYTEINL